MKRETKLHWQTFAFAAFATVAFLLAVQTQVAAQGTTQSDRSAFNYLFTSSASHNQWLEDAADKFDSTGVKSNTELGVKPNSNDEYPTPDFSAMEKWYEIVKYEYDFFTEPLLPRLYFVVKPKVVNPPTYFKMKFADKDEVALLNYQVHGIRLPIEVGEPQRIYGMAPKEKDMPKVKSIVISRIVE